MTEAQLTPEHIATLKDIADRHLARMARLAAPGVVVRSTGMSAEERTIFGAQNDVRSAQVEFSAAERALTSAQENYDRAVRLLERTTNRLDGLVQGLLSA